MIETIVISYLDAALDCPVSGAVPSDPPDTFVVIEKTGSRRVNLLDAATVAIQAYAPSIAEAAALNEQVKAAMFALPALDSVSSCALNSDYIYTDTARNRPRYQAVFEVAYYD